jgi:hypothetical protein
VDVTALLRGGCQHDSAALVDLFEGILFNIGEARDIGAQLLRTEDDPLIERAVAAPGGPRLARPSPPCPPATNAEISGSPSFNRSLEDAPCATLLLRREVHTKFVQEFLGHANVMVPLDRYSHSIPSMRRRTAQAMEKILRKARSRAR